jgi:hypothetical protein
LESTARQPPVDRNADLDVVVMSTEAEAEAPHAPPAASVRRRRLLVGVCMLAVAATSACAGAAVPPSGQVQTRRDLFRELRPVTLANCTLRRYGVLHDGGYLMCENLMGAARSAYSYGIDGRDDWGCDVAEQLRSTVHEYDCFNLDRPACDRGSLTFHEECLGAATETIDGRPYGTLASHVDRNGDGGHRLIVKIDVEGAEWTSLRAAPEDLLDRIDQLAIEFHGTDDPAFVETVKRLKRHFYVAHFHANNNACDTQLAPFTSAANEVLFVNRRIAALASDTVPRLPNPLDSPNRTPQHDCQPHF